MPLVTPEMVIDVVDENDLPAGLIERKDVFIQRANFRVAHTLIFNASGELLVQRLARTRMRHPGYWGSSVAAYIFAGESYEGAAQRRLAQELGISGLRLNYVGTTSMEDDGCLKFIGVFSANHSGPFRYDPTHIDALEFLPRSMIHALHSDGTRVFTPTFLQVLSFYESRV